MDKKTVSIIGVPMDLGQNRRGVDMGPSAMRAAGLHTRLQRLGHAVVDAGNVAVPNPEEAVAEEGARRLGAVAEVCASIYALAERCVEAGDFPIFLGGDHSISIGTVAAQACRDERVGLIWIDAHGDFNTPETSPSGNIHGMPVAVLAGDGPPELVDIGVAGAKIKPTDVVQIGIRDLDTLERERLSERGVNVFTIRAVDEYGIATIARQAVDKLEHVDRIHVSLDMDGLDPSVAPGVGTPVPGGLSYREAHLLMEILGDSGRVTSLDVVEVNPILDVGNRTAEMAVELMATILGDRILF